MFQLFWYAGEKMKRMEEKQLSIGINVEGTEKLTNELEDSKGSIVNRPRLLPSKCFPSIFHG
jgi:hypothetical protein